MSTLTPPRTPNLNSHAQSISLIAANHDDYNASDKIYRKKLSKFFGEENIYTDVPISKIEQIGLKAIMKSKAPLAYFLYKSLQDHASENLVCVNLKSIKTQFFYLEVDHYENRKFASLKEQKTASKKIYEQYLTKASLLEINVDIQVKRSVQALMEAAGEQQQLHMVFRPAIEHINESLEFSFQSFVSSLAFKKMKEELDGANVYTANGRMKARQMLINYVEAQSSTGLGDYSLRQNSLLEHMIKEYIKTILMLK